MSEIQTLSNNSKRGGARKGAGRPKKDQNAFSLGAWAGAQNSPSRGYIYLPLDPVQEYTASDRHTMIKKARYFYNNVGIATRAVDGISRYAVGTGLSPRPKTSDKKWNKYVLDKFENDCCTDSFAVDIAAECNFYQAQSALVKMMGVDGDVFSRNVISKESNRAMFQLVGGHAVGDPARNADQKWIDGVLTNQFRRPIKYRVLEDITGEKFTDYAADEINHVRLIKRVGYRRGVTWLHHAINHLHDISEILTYTKGSFKLASQMGLFIESEDQKAGFGANLIRSSNGTTTGQIYNETAVVNLKPGEKVQTLKNEHPGQSFEPFLNYLTRDICWGVGISPELLWSIAGIGGANTRFVLEDAQTFLDEVRDVLINHFCRPFYRYWLWKEIESGRISTPSNPDEWWLHEWLPPKDLTVDESRDGRLEADNVASGRMSFERYCTRRNINDEAEEDSIIEGILRRKEKCEKAGIPYEVAFPPAPGATFIPDQPDNSQTKPIPPEEDLTPKGTPNE